LSETGTRAKWRLGRAFFWGLAVGSVIIGLNLMRGTDFTAGTENAAQAGGAQMAVVILPLLCGLIGLFLAFIRNLFVK